jgi:hypothetical protein
MGGADNGAADLLKHELRHRLEPVTAWGHPDRSIALALSPPDGSTSSLSAPADEVLRHDHQSEEGNGTNPFCGSPTSGSHRKMARGKGGSSSTVGDEKGRLTHSVCGQSSLALFIGHGGDAFNF